MHSWDTGQSGDKRGVHFTNISTKLPSGAINLPNCLVHESILHGCWQTLTNSLKTYGSEWDADNHWVHAHHVSAYSDLGATILRISYGIEATDTGDEYIAIGERAVEGPTDALVLGALWVEFLPILRHLPSWFPGASYQRKAAKWRQAAMALKHTPFEKAMSDFVSVEPSMIDVLPSLLSGSGPISQHEGAGVGVWSLSSEIMSRDDHLGHIPLSEKEELAKNVAAVTYGGEFGQVPRKLVLPC